MVRVRVSWKAPHDLKGVLVHHRDGIDNLSRPTQGQRRPKFRWWCSGRGRHTGREDARNHGSQFREAFLNGFGVRVEDKG